MTLCTCDLHFCGNSNCSKYTVWFHLKNFISLLPLLTHFSTQNKILASFSDTVNITKSHHHHYERYYKAEYLHLLCLFTFLHLDLSCVYLSATVPLSFSPLQTYYRTPSHIFKFTPISNVYGSQGC